MKTLHLTLKKKWFDMIASGEKKEEYREIKPYWINRLLYDSFLLDAPIEGRVLVNEYEYRKPKPFDVIQFKNGYAKNAPTLLVECKGITIGWPTIEWSEDWPSELFIIKLGDIIKAEHP